MKPARSHEIDTANSGSRTLQNLRALRAARYCDAAPSHRLPHPLGDDADALDAGALCRVQRPDDRLVAQRRRARR